MKLYLEKALHYAKYMEITDPEQQIKDIVFKGQTQRNQYQNFRNLLARENHSLVVVEAFIEVCKVTYDNLKTGKYD